MRPPSAKRDSTRDQGSGQEMAAKHSQGLDMQQHQQQPQPQVESLLEGLSQQTKASECAGLAEANTAGVVACNAALTLMQCAPTFHTASPVPQERTDSKQPCTRQRQPHPPTSLGYGASLRRAQPFNQQGAGSCNAVPAASLAAALQHPMARRLRRQLSQTLPPPPTPAGEQALSQRNSASPPSAGSSGALGRQLSGDCGRPIQQGAPPGTPAIGPLPLQQAAGRLAPSQAAGRQQVSPGYGLAGQWCGSIPEAPRAGVAALLQDAAAHTIQTHWRVWRERRLQQQVSGCGSMQDVTLPAVLRAVC